MTIAAGETGTAEKMQRWSAPAPARRIEGRQRLEQAAGGWRMERAPVRKGEDFTREWDEHFATTAGFDAFVARHQAAIYRIALHVLKEEREAEEVAYDAFWRIHQAYWKRRRAGRPFHTPPIYYFYRTAKNRAIDAYRKAQRHAPTLSIEADDGERGLLGTLRAEVGGAETADEAALLAAARACILALQPPHREVCAHYYLEGLSLAETAAAVGLPYARVRGVLKSAREQIGRLLAPHLLATALDELSAADQALLRPYYAPGGRRTGGNEAPGREFAQARWRLIGLLLRWEIIFQRQPPEEQRALVAFARERDATLAAAAVTAQRRQEQGDAAPPCTPEEAAALVERAGAWLDRRLRAAGRSGAAGPGW